MNVARTRLSARLAATATATAIVTTGLALGVVSPAQAADTTTCAVSSPVLAVDTAGRLYQYPFLNAATPTAKFGTPTVIGGGWQAFGKVIAGGSGWVYALKADGLYVYHRTAAGTWDVQARKFGFLGAYAAASRANRIAADQRGTIFTLTDAGAVQAYRFDDAHEGLVAVQDLVLEADSSRAALVGAGDGVLYLRHTDGVLDRVRYEATSDRIISTMSRVGSGWNTFSRLFSPGGDVLFAMKANGDLFHYRFREDTRTWVISGHKVGAGWQVMRQATATTDSCRGASFVPQVATPATNATDRPGIATGAQSSDVDAVAADGTQGLVWGRYDGVSGGLQQSPFLFPTVYGSPSVTRLTDDRMSVLTTGPEGMMHGGLQKPDVFGLNPATDEGGRMATSPSSGTIGTVAFHFAVDPQGNLWVKRQLRSTGEFLPWRQVGVTGLAAVDVMVTDDNAGGLALGVVTPSGQLRLGSFDGTGTSGWTTVAEGASGTPDLEVYPGGNDGVIAYRGTDEQVHARILPLRTGGRSSEWQTLSGATEGDPGVAVTGSGHSIVVVRGSSGLLVGAKETEVLAGGWGAYAAQIGTPSGTAGSDPVTTAGFTYGSGRESWVPVQSVLSQNGSHRQIAIPTSPYFP